MTIITVIASRSTKVSGAKEAPRDERVAAEDDAAPSQMDSGLDLPLRLAGTLRPQKTAVLIAQRIVGEIADRGLSVGDALASERVMLERYGVARGTLREALRFLETQGILTMKPGPGGGAIVHMPDQQPLATSIALLLQFSGAPYRMILEARLAFEPSFAGIAAAKGTDEQLAAIQESVDAMRAQLKSQAAFLEENQRFHDLIARASGNYLFVFLLSSLRWITDGTALGVQYSDGQRRAIMKAHQQIASALLDRDEERARKAMRAHMQEFIDHVERRYPEAANRTLRWDQIA